MLRESQPRLSNVRGPGPTEDKLQMSSEAKAEQNAGGDGTPFDQVGATVTGSGFTKMMKSREGQGWGREMVSQVPLPPGFNSTPRLKENPTPGPHGPATFQPCFQETW